MKLRNKKLLWYKSCPLQGKQGQLKPVEIAQSFKIDQRIISVEERHRCDRFTFYKVLTPNCWISICQKFPGVSKKKLFNSQFICRKTETMSLAKKEKQLNPNISHMTQTYIIIMCKEKKQAQVRENSVSDCEKGFDFMIPKKMV